MSPTRHPKTTEVRHRQAGDGVARGAAAACVRALKQVAGFSLTEALTTVVIVGLVTTILAGGIGLATKQYTQQMSNAEAQMLYSSLQKILDTELRFVDEFKYDKTSGKVTSFESKHYMAQQSVSNPGTMEPTIYLCTIARMPGDVMVAQEPATPGQLAMASDYGLDKAYNPLLPSAAYNYGLQASVKTFTYNSTGNYFTLNLTISRPDGETVDGQILVDETFTVRPLNYSQTSSGGSGSGSGEGSGGNGQGGGSFKVFEDGNILKFETDPIICYGNTAPQDIKEGSVITKGGSIFYVVNKKIKKGDDLTGAENAGGNSAELIQVAMDTEKNPPIPHVISASMISDSNPAKIGMLCFDSEGNLYICTQESAKGPGNQGHWQLVTNNT